MSRENYSYNIKHIRNFSIIAHIDHGKSTLSDRFLEATKAVTSREMKEQLLDDMDLERERGITIKAHPVTMYYTAKNGNIYQFNLIDTPGHVDFSYEVSRSLSACEGAILIVDASQGIQAQTLANLHLALERNLTIIPVMNKIDLPTADTELVKKQIEDVLCIESERVIPVSAKTGFGINDVLERIVEEIPSPHISDESALTALVFDSYYDTYRGVMVYIRIISGEIRRKQFVKYLATDKQCEVIEVGHFTPNATATDVLRAGEVGYFVASIKKISDVRIGDTVTSSKGGTTTALPGFRMIQPVVFAGIYPVDASDFEELQDALNKLQLNDSALHIEQESSLALGFGFRCGFLGLLHLEITFERLFREFNLNLITTAPSVLYQIILVNGESKFIDNPAHYPDPVTIARIDEPWVTCRIISPSDYLGAIMNLGSEKRGKLLNTETLDGVRLLLTYEFPMNEIITGFNDRLKSISKGYASFDYEICDYRKGDITKLEIRVNNEPVDAFSSFVHQSKAEHRGRAICKKLIEVIPKQQFKVPIQAAIGGKVIARETISALAKNVTAKCYGGDITRKRKLWEKQKEGKKRMKEIGKVNIPQKAFMEVLRAEEK